MSQEPVFSLGSLAFTPYGLFMSLGLLLAALTTIMVAWKRNVDMNRAFQVLIVSAPAALLGGHIVYCLAMLPVLQADYGGWTVLFRPDRGGYTLYGAVFAVMLALHVLARITRTRTRELWDLAAPGAMLALCAGRIGEAFTGQGLGAFVEEGWFRRFPFAVCTYNDGEWSEWYVSVYVFEALAAFCLFLLALHRQKKGQAWLYVLTWLSASQIFLEQLRQDDCIRFGFVRFTQLCAAALFLALIIQVLMKNREHWILRLSVFAVSVLGLIFMEFCLEKPQFLPWMRSTLIVQTLLTVWGFLTYRQRMRPWQKGIAIFQCLLGTALTVCLYLGLEAENVILYVSMADCAAMMALCILADRRGAEDH